jgi:hypothetical protein
VDITGESEVTRRHMSLCFLQSLALVEAILFGFIAVYRRISNAQLLLLKAKTDWPRGFRSGNLWLVGSKLRYKHTRIQIIIIIMS